MLINKLLKRISDLEFEVERLEQELQQYKDIQKIGEARKFHKMFLKEFHKERGKNVYPDHDEIYKRYYQQKEKIVLYEKNELYKYINGQAYFRQDYVLGRENKVDEFKKE